jgi:hypothetical protein
MYTIIYLIITLIIIHFILYYFNFDFNDLSILNPFKSKDKISIENVIPEINECINELKTLNECINNGQINTSFP